MRLSFIPDSETGGTLLFADERKIKQILYNLIDNGIKYNEPGGSVSVAVTKVNREARSTAMRIVVEDTGVGISRDALAMLFQPFSQLSRVHTKPAEGTDWDWC